MDEKQLDLNAPLLSVRRLSTTSSNSNIDRILSHNSVRKSKVTRQQSLPVPRSQWEPEQEAVVPFYWEQIPGKAKDHRENPASHNIPNKVPSSQRFRDEQALEDAHADAISMLSNSFSCNFSEGNNSDIESSRSFTSDLQTRDYLMKRFLPAAKSMIVETPQYTKKKEAPVIEPPKYVKKVYSGELRPLLLEKYPVNNPVSPYVNHKEKDKESDVVEQKKKSGKKGFGLSYFLPKICTKRSSCLSNSVPAPKAKVHQSQSHFPESPGRIPRLSRRTSYSGPLTPSLEKQAMDAVIRKRAESRSKEVHEYQLKSNPLTRSGDSLPSSPHRGMSRSGRISPYRNESPRSPFHDGARFLGVPQNHQVVVKPKTCPSLNVKSHFSPRLMHDNSPPEKTLHIDWIQKPSNSSPNDGPVEELSVDGLVHVPPLPKSPSESWLWQKMTLKNPFPKKLQQTPPIVKSPKWETIVKTSNVHHDHVRYSEELLNVSKYPEISF